MGDTGLEPVTPCLSNEGTAYFTNFITAWFSVGYVAIILTDNDLQLYNFPVESRGVLVVSLESTTFWLQSDYSGKTAVTIAKTTTEIFEVKRKRRLQYLINIFVYCTKK